MIRVRIKSLYLAWVACIVAIIALANIKSYSPATFDPPYSIYKNISDKIISLELDPELIIVHKAFAEYFTFYTGIDALPWLPEYAINKVGLWRIATGLNAKSVTYFSKGKFESDLYHQLTPNYFLIREDLWQTLQINIKQEDPDLYQELRTWKNPHEIRPAYLLKNKR